MLQLVVTFTVARFILMSIVQHLHEQSLCLAISSLLQIRRRLYSNNIHINVTRSTEHHSIIGFYYKVKS